MAHGKHRWAWGTLSMVIGLTALGPARAAEESATEPKTAAPKAEKPGKAPVGGKPQRVTVNVSALSAKLKSSDPAALQEALEEAGSAGKGAAPLARPIEELLARGVTPEIDALALTTLGRVGAANSSDAILPYARHRSPEIRKKALLALVKTGGNATVGALRQALSDPDAGVRGVAASGLGAVKGHDGIDDLFRALDHQVTEAAASIGELCTPEECEKLAAKTGVFGLDVMTSGFDQIMFRPTPEIPDEEKLKIVGRVRELGTQEANKYLRDLQGRWPPNGSPKIKQALEQAVLATSGSH
jgi:HEAT repeat protein